MYPAALEQEAGAQEPPEPMPPEFESAQAASASALLDEIHAVSANTETFVTQLLRALTNEPLSQNAAFLLGERRSPAQVANVALQLLSLAGIPNRIVRGLVLEAYQSMELGEFRRIRSFPYYDVTAEYVLHHLMQHEAEHRSQLGALRMRAERALAAA